MRVLHVVKTSDGAVWAAKLAARLMASNVEVHVALPSLHGRAIPFWQRSGAALHACDLNFSPGHPGRLPAQMRKARHLVEEIAPDIIHSHFVGTTLLLRLALGKNHAVPRIFQVPGPLHLEHPFYRRSELSLAGENDFWIGSSRCIVNHYLRAGVRQPRVFLSYYGDDLTFADDDTPSGILKARIEAKPDEILIGSISWMYPPKLHLGQRIGLKAHEVLIDALGIVCRDEPRARGLIAGGAWAGADWYENRLKKRARRVAEDRIAFAGALPIAEARRAWRDLDLAVHVPISENCGGVVEPLLAQVPVVASRVGGLPEVIFEGLTGVLVPPRNPKVLADAILQCIDNRDNHRRLARNGSKLVRTMFDIQRTSNEVMSIYRHMLAGEPRPKEFDSQSAAETITAKDLLESQPNIIQSDVSADKETVSCPR